MIESNTAQASIQAGDNPSPSVFEPRLSVIVVSWNVRDHLARCLQALVEERERSGLDLEVIVVDNASHDGSPEVASRFPVRLLASERNLGYGPGTNAGLALATGRYVLVLNPDTVVLDGALASLVGFADTHLRAGIVSPRLLNPDGSLQRAAFRYPTLLMYVLDLFPLPGWAPGRLRRWLSDSPLNGRYTEELRATEPFRVDHPLGACMLVRREAIQQCGLFDESIFMYSEEIDLALRYRASGWECWQEPSARVIHAGGQSTGQAPEAMFVALWRSRLLIYDRYYSRVARLALRALLAAAMCRDIVLSRTSRLLDRQESPARSAQERRARAVLRLALRR